MAGNIGLLDPAQLEAMTPFRLRVDVSKEIDKLNMDVNLLTFLLDAVGKEEASQLTFNWLTKERMEEWTTINSFGGLWAAGAAVSGTINIPNAERYKIAPADLIKATGTAANPISEVNLFVTAVGLPDSGGAGFTAISAQTYDNNTTVDFSAAVVPSVDGLLWLGNSFELGTGMGSIRSSQPTPNLNHIQIIQTPYGNLKEMKLIEYDAGGTEPAETEEEAKILHEYSKELTAFFGQKHMATVGYQNGVYQQGFTGGLMEAIQTNIADLGGDADLTYAEWGKWVNQCTRYAKRPVIFAGEIVFEALSWWLGQTLETRQDESTLGIAVSTYKNEYGQLVKVIPHRELLRKRYAGYAFSVDLDDMKYKYLKGADTHVVMGIQQPDLKLEINEFRTWMGYWIGNEKRHGVMMGVETISA